MAGEVSMHHMTKPICFVVMPFGEKETRDDPKKKDRSAF
jgi:hypothetical protein